AERVLYPALSQRAKVQRALTKVVQASGPTSDRLRLGAQLADLDQQVATAEAELTQARIELERARVAERARRRPLRMNRLRDLETAIEGKLLDLVAPATGLFPKLAAELSAFEQDDGVGSAPPL